VIDNSISYDVIIVGSGPSGLACGIECRKSGLKYQILEKGCLADSIQRFPTNLVFFSTPDLLEIGDVPFIIANEKPSRSDILEYYRRVTEHHKLNVKLYAEVRSVSGNKPVFRVMTDKVTYTAKHLIIATGQYDTPNLLNIPGEDLDKVSHYYSEAHLFYKRRVAVIGGKNSAVEACLELYRHGVDVTLIHRGSSFGKSVKYWVLPDIENRVKEGSIKAYFNTTVAEITDDHVIIRNGNNQRTKIENDHVFALTGYQPDRAFLESLGIELGEKLAPAHNPETLETNVPGIYVAGVITVGSESSKVFIENSRHHGTQIIGHILNGSK
jgi:thioredoxin reductase (NADPH)